MAEARGAIVSFALRHSIGASTLTIHVPKRALTLTTQKYAGNAMRLRLETDGAAIVRGFLSDQDFSRIAEMAGNAAKRSRA